MDLVSSLKDDHEIVRKFIQELESEESLAIKHKIFAEMLIFVRAHLRAEEMALYSKSLRSTNYEISELGLDGYEEHHLLEDLVYRIKNARSDDSVWLVRVKDYCQILDLHMAGEEADYFPELKNYFTDAEMDRAAIVYLKSRKSEITLAEQDQSRSYDVANGNQISQ